MITHLLDTNIVSRYLTRVPHFVELIIYSIGIEKVCISVVTKIELLNWLSNYKGLTIQERNTFKKFIIALPIKHINTSISKIADELVSKNINTKPADTLIGATAKYYDLVIVTTNDKDFSQTGCLIIKAKQ